MPLSFSHHLKSSLAGTVLALTLGMAASTQAASVAILDQIGPSSATVGATSYSTQFFDPANSAYDVVSADDFFAPASLLNVTEVQAAFQGRNGFVSYAGITGWSVEIYSSAAAVGNSLIGDIASVNLSPAQVTVDTSFGPAPQNGALITLPVNIVLPASKAYYIGVIPTNDFSTNGQLFVTTAAFGTTQANAVISNPNGGFNLQRPQNLNADLAYRVYATTVVPEPSTYAFLGIGVIALGVAIRRRRTA